MYTLEASKLFRGLSPDELDSLKQICQERRVQAGEVVFKAGDMGDGLYVVCEGRVQIAAMIGQDESRVLCRLGPGDFFGEMALLDNEPRSATVAAEEETLLFFISRTELLQMLERCPKVAFSLVREFSRRMREFNRQYVQEVLQSERLGLVGRFARSIVHDFKNPLGIIGLAADLGAMEGATQEMRDVARRRIRKQVDRLSNMINELLEFTRGTKTSIVLAPTHYGTFVKQLIDEIRPEAAEKSVALVLTTPPPDVQLLLDPQRLTHVFYNLIHNAIDFMPNGGKIMFRFTVTDKEVATEVEDTGSGIDPAIAGRLFQPFATHGKAHGTGLGLSICQRIILDHRGQIRAHSEPGHGAVFTFTLPRPAQAS